MFSVALELVGLGLVSWGLGLLLGAAAAVIFAGCSLLFIGSVTDDDAVGARLKRFFAWGRFVWWRQVARENDEISENGSPHPPLHVDPEAQAAADRMARARKERAKVRDLTPALRRFEGNGEFPDDEDEF